ncbi:uncharacterized protein P174DRAFT_262482 [Aspergillus novofumigatus IBT 16806]|uniref:Uncharacterized protein n=1 Tax=Aspergillus novofumigatus (strain IBT 16806) TaxID=1392255 RepID=A0A2I1C3L3_ASPN1|nr:uncharacterized protein P174DRAFT_262482 [Aspergillus novofumigatus IBT 16806]PKX92171.1 hypothetical protein P174DRAFT_262482 [Aspergillus novofumigatus IBT 16806]
MYEGRGRPYSRYVRSPTRENHYFLSCSADAIIWVETIAPDRSYQALPILARQITERIRLILLFLLRRRNRPFDPARSPHCHREGRNILGDDGARANRRTLSDSDTRQNDDIRANPAVILDEDGMAEFHKLPPRQDTRVVAGGDDADVRSYLDPVTNDDEAGVQHSETDLSVSPAYATSTNRRTWRQRTSN